MENVEFKQMLGQLIYRLRKERKISQEQLALDSDVDRTPLGEIERGEANPTIDTLSKIAKVLGQTLGSLIIEAEELNITKKLSLAETQDTTFGFRSILRRLSNTHFFTIHRR